MGIKDRIDEAQQRHRRVGIAVATFKKFSEDRSGHHAAMIAFWAFFSIFPLFLVFVTILGYVLPESEKADVLSDVAELFPLLDPKTVGSLSGQLWPLIVGGGTALWSGLAVVKAVQYAFNSAWELPEKDHPGLVEQTLRSVIALAVIGVGLVLATIISGFVTGEQSGVDLQWFSRLAGFVIAILLDVGLFVIAFRLLTSRKVTTRDVLPGALLAGIVFFILQQLSSFIISSRLSGAQSTYGGFATVITILWWFYLQSQITLLGAQLNVVLRDRLHPRSVFGGPDTRADHRALQAYAEERAFHESEEIHARIDGEPAEQRARRAPR